MDFLYFLRVCIATYFMVAYGQWVTLLKGFQLPLWVSGSPFYSSLGHLEPLVSLDFAFISNFSTSFLSFMGCWGLVISNASIFLGKLFLINVWLVVREVVYEAPRAGRMPKTEPKNLPLSFILLSLPKFTKRFASSRPSPSMTINLILNETFEKVAH